MINFDGKPKKSRQVLKELDRFKKIVDKEDSYFTTKHPYIKLLPGQLDWPLHAWDYPIEEITWDKIVSFFGTNDGSKLIEDHTRGSVPAVIERINQYAETKLDFLQVRISDILKERSVEMLDNISKVTEVIQLISANQYMPLTYWSRKEDLKIIKTLCNLLANELNKLYEKKWYSSKRVFFTNK